MYRSRGYQTKAINGTRLSSRRSSAADRQSVKRDYSQSGDLATETWNTLRDTMHRTALTIFGKKTSKIHDWFETKSTEMTPVIEAKRAASEKNIQIVRAARGKAQLTTMHCANEYWTPLSEDIQTVTATGNIRGMYDGIRKGTKTSPEQNNPPNKSSTGEIISRCRDGLQGRRADHQPKNDECPGTEHRGTASHHASHHRRRLRTRRRPSVYIPRLHHQRQTFLGNIDRQ